MKKTLTYASLILVLLCFTSFSTVRGNITITDDHLIPDTTDTPRAIISDTYRPIDNNSLNVKEAMTLTPIFTPDNALDAHAAWIGAANTSIVIQNQYIKLFDRDHYDLTNDTNPIIRELVKADARGVDIRVQVREESDTDLVGDYLNKFDNIEVRYMGNSGTQNSNGWLTYTHNKLLIVDSKVSLISSINYGVAFLDNREAGMVIQSSTVAAYYLKFFEDDWEDGEPLPDPGTEINGNLNQPYTNTIESHTNIPYSNFTDSYNVSAYVNPDSASELIFKYLEAAKESIYVTMYTISRQDFVDVLVQKKKENPSMDIQVQISQRRVGADENIDTAAAAKELTDNLIPVYNTTSDFSFTHAKYWIIDHKHTFIYSGNWSPRSVTRVDPDYTYASDDPNRDMGIAIHNAPDIANFIKQQVWDEDLKVASAWDLPIGITQNSFEKTEVVSGTVSLSATVSDLSNASVSYRFGSNSYTSVALNANSFSVNFDTTELDNGITTFEVKAEADEGTFSDSVVVNVVNKPSNTNFRLLITEIHANPDIVDDSEGEFFEVTNSFDFDLLIEGWQTGIFGDDLYIFPIDYTISALSSIIIARDATGFQGAYGVEADIELSMNLANSGDTVVLTDQNGNYIDVVGYGDTTIPDGSEAVDAPGAGESANRAPLYYDSNRASDFVIGNPTPKGVVPNVPLTATSSTSDTSSSSDLTDVPFNFLWTLFAFGVTVLWKRRRI